MQEGTYLEREYERGFRSHTDSDDDSGNYSEADEDYMPESPLALGGSCSQAEEEEESESGEEDESEGDGEGEEESKGQDDTSEIHGRRGKHGGAKVRLLSQA